MWVLFSHIGSFYEEGYIAKAAKITSTQKFYVYSIHIIFCKDGEGSGYFFL